MLHFQGKLSVKTKRQTTADHDMPIVRRPIDIDIEDLFYVEYTYNK